MTRQHTIHRRPDGSIDTDRHCRQVRRVRRAAWRLALARLRRRFAIGRTARAGMGSARPVRLAAPARRALTD